MVGEEARLQGMSEEVETACIYKSFKNVGCEGELEGHRVEGVFSSFAKIGKTRACLLLGRFCQGGRGWRQGKGEGMRVGVRRQSCRAKICWSSFVATSLEQVTSASVYRGATHSLHFCG